MDDPRIEAENMRQARGEYMHTEEEIKDALSMRPDCGVEQDERFDLGEIELEEQAKKDVKLEDWLNDVYKRLEEAKIRKAAKEQNGFFFDAMKRNGVL